MIPFAFAYALDFACCWPHGDAPWGVSSFSNELDRSGQTKAKAKASSAGEGKVEQSPPDSESRIPSPLRGGVPTPEDITFMRLSAAVAERMRAAASCV